MRIAGVEGYDWLTGGIVTAIGAFVVWKASTYPVGSASQMGPGYFPMLFGILLIIFGVAIVVIEGRQAEGSTGVQIQARSLIFVSLGLASFAALVERAGLVPAVIATTILCCFANKETRPLTAVSLAAAASVLASAIFVWGLQMPIHLFRWF